MRLENIGGNARIDLRRGDLVRAVDVKGTVDLKGRGQDLELAEHRGRGDRGWDIRRPDSASKTWRSSSAIKIRGSRVRFENLPGQARMATGEFTANNVTGRWY